MNDEIKEILDYLKKIADRPEVNYSTPNGRVNETIENIALIRATDCKILLDYITKLQQENEHLITELNRYIHYSKTTGIEELMQENERLKEEIKFIEDINHKNLGERIRLQQENERLKKELEDKCWDEANIRADILLEQDDYKSRCEKASDNLKRNYWIKEHEHNDDVVNMTLNILQNGSDDNEN